MDTEWKDFSNLPDQARVWIYGFENNMSSDISWRKFAFRVSDYVNLTSNIQLKFIASDSIRLGQNLDGGSLIEAAVDDFMLYEGAASTSINDLLAAKPKLIKVTDLLGREVEPNNVIESTTLLYIYDDGSVEKKITIN